MFYNEIKEVAKQPALLAPLAGLLNPATIIPFVAVGVVAITAFTVTGKLKKNNKRLIAKNEELNRDIDTLSMEAEYQEEQGFELYDQPLPTVGNMDDEALKKEMMRQTMSELGKRSAAKRGNKKARLI
jgi:hypothetical protein